MNNNCLNILKWTEAQLKYTYDVSLQEATPQELHEALGQAVMMAISDDWSHSKKTRMPNRKAYYISAEYLIGRLVYSNLFNLGILDEMKELFAEHGVAWRFSRTSRTTLWATAALAVWRPASWTAPLPRTFPCPLRPALQVRPVQAEL